VPNREVPVHAFAGVPLATASLGINTAIEKLSFKPVIDVVNPNGWQ
jgi:hypothetical protein